MEKRVIDARTRGDEKMEPVIDFKKKEKENKYKLEVIGAIAIGIILLILLSGCSTGKIEPTVITKIEPVETIKVVAPKIPSIECDFEGEGLEPTGKLLECVIFQKRILDYLTYQYDPSKNNLEEDFKKYMEEYRKKISQK